MSEVDRRPRPGLAFAGFAVAGVLLLAVFLAYQAGVFATAGWAGGEYAYLFLGIAIAAVVVGVGLQVRYRSSPWRPFGFGLVLGGSAGVLFTVMIIVVVWYAFSNFAF